MTGTVVDIRLILKHALELNATSIVHSHNHPSGILKRSEADINITKKNKKAAQFMDIKVLDHLIITDQSYFSFLIKGGSEAFRYLCENWYSMLKILEKI